MNMDQFTYQYGQEESETINLTQLIKDLKQLKISYPQHQLLIDDLIHDSNNIEEKYSRIEDLLEDIKNLIMEHYR